MDLDTVRPILSGLAGAFIATWLGARWTRRRSASTRESDERLLHRYRGPVRLANLLFLTGFGIALAMYAVVPYPSEDPTPLLVGVGLSGWMPILTLWLVPRTRSRSPRDAFRAFAIGQSAPAGVVYAIIGFFAALLPFGLYRMLA